jgi:hypothetical protein
VLHEAVRQQQGKFLYHRVVTSNVYGIENIDFQLQKSVINRQLLNGS